jgi:hypothetical protein
MKNTSIHMLAVISAFTCMSSTAFAQGYSIQVPATQPSQSLQPTTLQEQYMRISPDAPQQMQPASPQTPIFETSPYAMHALSEQPVQPAAVQQQVYPQSNVAYVTGGIGDEERLGMEQVRNQYNTHIMNSGRDGAFIGDTKVTIMDKSGSTVLSSDAGPLFYAKLPAGTYTVIATVQGVEQKKSVTLSNASHKNLHFVW